MSLEPRFRVGLVLLSAGLLLTAVPLFLYYVPSEPQSRSLTFTFTAWFSSCQVLFLFASLLYAAIKDGRPDAVVPVNSATVVVTFCYNIVAVGTILLFTRVLLPQHATAKTYYAICIAELGVAIALVILLQMVSIAHQAGHAQGVASRQRVEKLLADCDCIAAKAAIKGWKLTMDSLAEKIRFSEGLRRNPALVDDVGLRLSQLESLTNSPARETSYSDAQKLMTEIASLASRRG
jgi:hypothetical protein